MNDLTIRTDLRPGDIGYLIHRHGLLYAAELGFGAEMEAYVAEPLGRFARTRTDRERLWIADASGTAVGWIAIVRADDATAQLRWFLIEREWRGRGLGRRLISDAVQFSREAGYQRVILWTIPQLTAAARLYASFGFAVAEEKAGGHGGPLAHEQRYELRLTAG